MPKLVQRLLIFFIGIPLVIGLVFVPFFYELPFHIAVCTFSCIGSLELYDMFSKNSPLLPKPLVVFLNLLIPVSTYLCVWYPPLRHRNGGMHCGRVHPHGLRCAYGKNLRTFEYGRVSLRIDFIVYGLPHHVYFPNDGL